MEGGIIRGHGPLFGKIYEDLIGDSPFQEQGESEAPHGNVAGFGLTHKVGSPWDEETDWVMPHKCFGGFQELAEVSDISI